MSGKKTGQDYVCAWLDTLSSSTTQQDQAKALRDMIRIVLSQYDPKIIVSNHNVTKVGSSES